MERLTVRTPESDEAYLSCEKCGKKAISECWDEMDCQQTVLERLAAIEDILGEEYDLNRLFELVEADRDGRCVVLPCKVGEKAYVIDDGDYHSKYKAYAREKEVTEISWKKVRNGKDLGFGLILKGGNCNTSARYKLSSIGKTVFLTREAAEAALKGEQDG